MASYQEIAAMDTTEYKQYHEFLMQNNHGSTALHTYFCIFFTIQCSVLCSIKVMNIKSLQHTYYEQYTYEYIFIILPLIFAHTILSEHIHLLNIIIFSILLYEFTNKLKSRDVNQIFNTKNTFPNNRIQAITVMRGLTYLITVFCILAVDFNDFPRYLAKTENYGYSLMDTGVGLFALMSGLVHKDLRYTKLINVIKTNIKFIVVLLSLGITRFLSVKQLDYQEHVTEYGVHWNFFFTLAVCKLLSTFLLYISNRELLFSILTITIHEFLLYYKLEEWVFSNVPRDSLISANREGISSTLGYVSLYLFAAHLKKVLSNKTVNRFHVLKNLVLGFIFMSIISYVIGSFRHASRTLANAAYCTYLQAMLISGLAILYLSQILFEDEKKKLRFNVPLILENINDNGLSYFLVANLLTGAINLSTKTLLMSSRATFAILNLYMIVTIIFTVYLKKKGLKI